MAHAFTHFTHILCIILDSSTQLYPGDTVAVLLTAKSVHNMVAAPWRCVVRRWSRYPGKRLQNEMERSTMFNGKTHYFYGHFQ